MEHEVIEGVIRVDYQPFQSTSSAPSFNRDFGQNEEMPNMRLEIDEQRLADSAVMAVAEEWGRHNRQMLISLSKQ